MRKETDNSKNNEGPAGKTYATGVGSAGNTNKKKPKAGIPPGAKEK